MLAFEARQLECDEFVLKAYLRFKLFGEGHGELNGFQYHVSGVILQHLNGKHPRAHRPALTPKDLKDIAAHFFKSPHPETPEDIAADYYNLILLPEFKKFARSDIELNHLFGLLNRWISEGISKLWEQKLLVECLGNPQQMLHAESLGSEIITRSETESSGHQ